MKHHGAGLQRLKVDEGTVEQLKEEWRQAELSDADRAMLLYSEKLTMKPAEINKQDVQALHHAGFSDAAILDICQITCYYNYVNRLADGLGVELESFWEEIK